ncbi:MAG: hypothetical protein ABW360_10020 [Phenylobacterium sp.]
MATRNPWVRLAFDSFALGAEAQGVVALRMLKLAGGGAAAAVETQLMISEKLKAAAEVQAQVMTSLLTGSGHLAPQRAVSQYRRTVRANRRRLTRP